MKKKTKITIAVVSAVAVLFSVLIIIKITTDRNDKEEEIKKEQESASESSSDNGDDTQPTSRPVYTKNTTPKPAKVTEIPVTKKHEATKTPEATQTAEVTDTPTPVKTVTPTDKPVATEKPAATNTPTSVPVATVTPVNTPTGTTKPTATSTSTPKPTNTPVPTNTTKPTAIPTATNTPTPRVTNTPIPTTKPGNTPTNTPKPTNTTKPTNTPVPTACTHNWEDSWVVVQEGKSHYEQQVVTWDEKVYYSGPVRYTTTETTDYTFKTSDRWFKTYYEIFEDAGLLDNADGLTIEKRNDNTYIRLTATYMNDAKWQAVRAYGGGSTSATNKEIKTISHQETKMVLVEDQPAISEHYRTCTKCGKKQKAVADENQGMWVWKDVNYS